MNAIPLAWAAPVETFNPRTGIALPEERADAVMKRWFEFALAAALIVLTAPVVLLAVVLVKLTSRGPAFYSQVRLGRHGTPFWIYKIRTMTHECERHSGAVWATRNDPRVFPVGRVLRVLHLDELPQLFNVLRGDMALIGPRPERPEITADLARDIPGFPDRLSVRPGLTGLAQVQFPADTDLGSVCRKLVADLHYVRSAGPWLDFRIVVATGLYLLHLPVSWRRRALGRHAERLPLSDERTRRRDRNTAVYEVPQNSDRIVAVQGLRAVAASLVFLVHFLSLFGVYLGAGERDFVVKAVDALARTGTDAFLLISGFLIYGMCIRRSRPYGDFLMRRVWRIYPTFLVVFVLYLALSAAFPASSKIPAAPSPAAVYLLENLALLTGLTGTPSLICVTWTLSYELLLYVTLPLLVGLTGMRLCSPAMRIAVLLAVWVGYLAYCGIVSPAHVRLSAYFAGFLAYEVVQGRKGRLHWSWEAIAVLVAIAAGGAAVLLRTQVVSFPAVQGIPNAAACVRSVALSVGLFAVASCCFAGNGCCSRALSLAPLRWLGNRSYSFYLIHGLVLNAAALVVPKWLPPGSHGPVVFWFALPVAYLGALAVAALLFALVEQRFADGLRDKQPVIVAGETSSHEASGLDDTLHDLSTEQTTIRVAPAPARSPSRV